MSIDERHPQPDPAQIRQLVGEQISQAPPPHAWASVAAREPARRPVSERSPARSRVVLVAVAASLIALVVGLVVVGTRGEPTDVSGPVASLSALTPVPLADVTDIAPDQWVIPAEIQGEMEFQFAMRSGERRSVFIGPSSEPEQLTIHVDSIMPVNGGASESLIDGRPWVVAYSHGGWQATLLETTPTVMVYGPGSFDADAEQLLGSLQIVPTDLLPYSPLDLNGPMTEVAIYEHEGERWVLSTQEANGYYCSNLAAVEGGGGGCGRSALPGSDVFFSFGGGGGYNYVDGSTVIRANDWGAVSDDVALVEVEFIDGSVVAVEPVNTTDRFDGLRFWVVVADVDLAEDQRFDGLTPVEEVRAFDAAGELLDTQRPSGR